MSPQPAERLVLVGHYAERLEAARQGEKSLIVREACQLLNVKAPAFYRALGELRPKTRKSRTDAGSVELPFEEAQLISAYLMEGYRANNKRIVSLETAVAALRANGKILAAKADPDTGELKPLSLSAIRRALKHYTLDPSQLRQPTPHTKMRSKYPNHVWQVDGSVCVLFYLPGNNLAVVGLDQAEHYKNKPENLKAIEQCRVIRYVMTDHATGVTLWRYYPHAESGPNTVAFLAWCMAEKPDPRRFPVHGRPKILVVDPGATAAGLVQRYCQRLGIELIVNERHRPRAKGSVEQAQNRVETAFESGLRFYGEKVHDFDSLNAAAYNFQIHYNATKVHTRHGYTRFDAWNFIKAQDLVKTGPEKTLVELATHEPVTRTVTGNLTVQFQSRIWRVDTVPGVLVKGKVKVHWHPFIPNTAMAVTIDAEGREVHHQLADVTGHVDPYNNDWGFQADAAVWGEERKSRSDTLADTQRKALQKLAAQEPTQEAADKKRSHKGYVPFGGEVNPYRQAETEATPDYLPKRGTLLDLAAPKLELIPLTFVQALKKAKGEGCGQEFLDELKLSHPHGLQEAELDALVAAWRQGKSTPPKLSLVK